MRTIEPIRSATSPPVRLATPPARSERQLLMSGAGNLAAGRLLVQRACACGGACAECEGEERTKGLVQRASAGDGERIDWAFLRRLLQRSQGSILNSDIRAVFEPRFGADFSGVRVHTDRAAAEAAHALSAHAFTTGQDIYFASSRYDPQTVTGRHLLAHELTHTLQQSRRAIAARSSIRLDTRGDPHEREAERIAAAVIASGPATSPLMPMVHLAPAALSVPTLQRSVLGDLWSGLKEGATSAGGKIAAGARTVGAAAEWASGKIAAGGQWLVGVAKEKLEAAWECAKATGRGVENILTLNVTSLTNLLGISPPAEGSAGALSIVLAVLRHPCLRMLPGYSLIGGLALQLQSVYRFIEGAWRIAQDPTPVINAIKDAVGAMIQSIPERAYAVARRVISFSEPRPDHLHGIWRHLEPKLEYLTTNWWDVLKETGWDLLWPWPGVWKDLQEIWVHIKVGAAKLWDLDFGGALDELLAVWRIANNAIGRLYGWFFLASVLVGAIIGAFFGGAGAIPGAAAGAALAGKVGMGLLISVVAAEGLSLGKAVLDLRSAAETDEEMEDDYEQISNSALVLAITGALFAVGALAARFARAIISRVAGRVWRLPARRGRRGTTSRGDVIEVRVFQSEAVRAVLRGRRITWLEATRRNFPVIDLVEGGHITITPRPGLAPTYTVRGGRLISVKSTARTGADTQRAITGWIDDIAGFQQVQNVSVQNPAGRMLVVAVEQDLERAIINAIEGHARQHGVTLQLTTHLPPTHPSLVFVDQVPAVMAAAGIVASGERPVEEQREEARRKVLVEVR